MHNVIFFYSLQHEDYRELDTDRNVNEYYTTVWTWGYPRAQILYKYTCVSLWRLNAWRRWRQSQADCADLRMFQVLSFIKDKKNDMCYFPSLLYILYAIMWTENPLDSNLRAFF